MGNFRSSLWIMALLWKRKDFFIVLHEKALFIQKLIGSVFSFKNNFQIIIAVCAYKENIETIKSNI